jgi:hypothetical protein
MKKLALAALCVSCLALTACGGDVPGKTSVEVKPTNTDASKTAGAPGARFKGGEGMGSASGAGGADGAKKKPTE